MNKLLIFPLGIMFMLTVYAVAYTGDTATGNSENFSDASHIGVNGTADFGEVNIQKETFNIWGATGAMVILIASIGVGIVAGIKLLGSGLSDTAQTLIYQSILFLGLWACLSVMTSQIMFAESIITFVWVGLTIMFIIGLGLHFNQSAGG